MNWSTIPARVDEVAELRLPEDERLGRGDGVAVLEAERGALGERRVVELERGVRSARCWIGVYVSPVSTSWRTSWRCENVPRSVSWPVSGSGSLDEQARERERLGLAPVDAALLERLARRSSCFSAWMDREASGTRDEQRVELAQALGGDGSDDLRAGAVRDPALAR
jgi:hypothetical protein